MRHFLNLSAIRMFFTDKAANISTLHHRAIALAAAFIVLFICDGTVVWYYHSYVSISMGTTLEALPGFRFVAKSKTRRLSPIEHLTECM